MIPGVGRIVHYKLGEFDLAQLEGKTSINRHTEGQVVAAIVVKVWAEEPTEDTSVDLQLFLDGQHQLWVTSRSQGDKSGQWADPRPPAPDPEPTPDPEPEPEPTPQPSPAPDPTPAPEPAPAPAPAPDPVPSPSATDPPATA